MTTATRVYLQMNKLSDQQQREVLAFIENLPLDTKKPLIDPYGMLAGYDTTEEEIVEARREMWGNFPRSDF